MFAGCKCDVCVRFIAIERRVRCGGRNNQANAKPNVLLPYYTTPALILPRHAYGPATRTGPHHHRR